MVSFHVFIIDAWSQSSKRSLHRLDLHVYYPSTAIVLSSSTPDGMGDHRIVENLYGWFPQVVVSVRGLGNTSLSIVTYCLSSTYI